MERIVDRLIRSHFEIEENIDQIIWIRDGDEREIRLIEVNRATLPTGSVEAFCFAPSLDVPIPVRVADVTPQEWERVRNGQIPLPRGWTLERAKVFQRPG
jgi:hypothetical protein